MEVENIILEYFTKIYSITYPTEFEASLSAVGSRVSEDMNAELLRDFREEEVWRALMQMHPTKSPGPYGMSPIFFKSIGMWWVLRLFKVLCIFLEQE